MICAAPGTSSPVTWTRSRSATDGYAGALKIQAAGPWTLGATLELATGHKVVSDPGAARDLTDSLAEGLRLHVAEVARRVPGATVVGAVGRAGAATRCCWAGSRRRRATEPSGRSVRPWCAQALTQVLEVVPAGGRVVHCCDADVPLGLLREAGADAIASICAVLTTADYDALGRGGRRGLSLWLGVLPALDGPIDATAARDALVGLWRSLGFAAERARRTRWCRPRTAGWPGRRRATCGASCRPCGTSGAP